MAISVAEQERVKSMRVADARTLRARAEEYMDRADLSHSDVGARIGYSRAAVQNFMHGSYTRISGNDLYIRAALQEYIEQHPIDSLGAAGRARTRLFATENYRRIRRYFTRAVEQGEVALLYGPPGTQKTFVLERLIAERNLAGQRQAIYVYASDRMRPLALLKRIARGAGALSRGLTIERLLNNLLQLFRCEAGSSAICVDEAQHLDVHALELLRELHDRSGCGLVLAGSHTLYENFLRGRQHLEQWLSRIDWKDPLPGLQEDEVAQIAARELGNGQPARLSKAQVAELVRMCRVEDVFGRDAAGKHAVRPYLSVRRLVKSIAQLKEERSAA